MALTSTQYNRIKTLGVEPTPVNLQIVELVYDKPKAFAAIKQLIELRQLMSSFGVKSKKDLECLLENSVKGV